MMNLFDVYSILVNISTCIQWCRDNGLLLKEYTCVCSKICNIIKDKCRKDSEIFRCPRCRKTYSIRTSSFFERSKLPIPSILGVIYLFSCEISVKNCAVLLKGIVSRKAIVQWYVFLREVLSEILLRNPIVLKGIIEVDECLMGYKRKYGKGKYKKKQQWVFGLVQRKPDFKFLSFVVKDRQKVTLYPLINRHVEKGSTIISDGASVYRSLHWEGYKRDTVNHSQTFVSDTGAHTNTLEGTWGNIKRKLSIRSNTNKKTLALYLDECMYRYNYKHESMFMRIISDIAVCYPV